MIFNKKLIHLRDKKNRIIDEINGDLDRLEQISFMLGQPRSEIRLSKMSLRAEEAPEKLVQSTCLIIFTLKIKFYYLLSLGNTSTLEISWSSSRKRLSWKRNYRQVKKKRANNNNNRVDLVHWAVSRRRQCKPQRARKRVWKALVVVPNPRAARS